MGRRKQSLFEDVIDVAASLPWKWGVGLALIAYLGFHVIATLPPATTVSMTAKNYGEVMGGVAVRQMMITLSMFLQYVIPAALLLGAGVSFFRQSKRNRLHSAVAHSPSRETLERMSWREFETLVGEAFRRKGYQVIERGGAGPDGGVDVELRMGSDKYLVQCKQWKIQRVGVAPVRELFGVMTAEGAVGGFVVASGEFTEEARKFAEGRSIKVVDARGLLGMIKHTGGAAAASPVCPSCGSGMVKRVTKRGVNAGAHFWGCSRFPACRGMTTISS